MINVLVFPCGSEIGLEVHNALKFCKDINLIGLSSVSSHGRMVYDTYLEDIPYIKDANFIEKLNEIIKEYEIDCIIPAYDDVILYLAEKRDEINCKVITADYKTCDICRSKKKTYEYFKGMSFIPETYSLEELTEDKLPIFAKPDIGQGSQGIAVIREAHQIDEWQTKSDSYVFCELLPGEEYTVDCFSANGEVIVMSMRERVRIKTGISVNTKVIEASEEVMNIGREINNKLSFEGVWFFQVKKDASGNFKLLEIAPRVAGSMCVSRARGFNYILNSIYVSQGINIKPIPKLLKSAEVDRAFISRYNLDIAYDTVYLDFDDTVTLKGKVNPMLMALIYQWKNDNKVIKIITRHAKNIYETMASLNIEIKLFDEIIEVKEEEMKSKYITESNAIFIDDSFRERYDVSKNKGIPVFDVDCIETLLNWRY